MPTTNYIVKHPANHVVSFPRQTSLLIDSPDGDTVSNHLKKTEDCDITISPQDILCYNCYKLHCSILSTLNESQEADDALQADIRNGTQ